MELEKGKKAAFVQIAIWLAEGIVVGFGAILPGISGGALCVSFGMYRPAIETISNISEGIKKHGFMLGVFFSGVAMGFVGLSGIAALLLEKNTVAVTCAFIGFIIGTLPEMWEDAGSMGRNKYSYVSAASGFVIMICLLSILQAGTSLSIEPGTAGYIICGILWGLSFIVPGLSSSSLLLFFNLYQPMLAGIAAIDMAVLIPMGAGMAVCTLLLSQLVSGAYKKHYPEVSHAVLGVVAATVVMIIPSFNEFAEAAFLNTVLMIAGAVMSYKFTCLCHGKS